MRIRKRFLSLSSVLPPPPDPHSGDHHHHHQPPVLLVQQKQLHPNGNLRHDTHSQPTDPPPYHHPLPPPSDHTTPIGLPPSTWVPSGPGGDHKETIDFMQKELEGEKVRDESEREITKTKSNDTGRKESILGSEADGTAGNAAGTTPAPTPLTTAHLVLKGWFDGDRLIPIKKRRGSFGKRVNHDVEDEEEEMMKAKTGSKTDDEMQEKKQDWNSAVIDEEKTEVVLEEASATNEKKKRMKNGKRGNVIMEGSRCSRVNGRGWRCCQPTLVGYSLCEHHLGKGRLRSVANVRGKTRKVAPRKQQKEKKNQETEKIMLLDHHELEEEDEDEDWKKLGMVKARSISSLLGQTKTADGN